MDAPLVGALPAASIGITNKERLKRLTANNVLLSSEISMSPNPCLPTDLNASLLKSSE